MPTGLGSTGHSHVRHLLSQPLTLDALSTAVMAKSVMVKVVGAPRTDREDRL